MNKKTKRQNRLSLLYAAVLGCILLTALIAAASFFAYFKPTVLEQVITMPQQITRTFIYWWYAVSDETPQLETLTFAKRLTPDPSLILPDDPASSQSPDASLETDQSSNEKPSVLSPRALSASDEIGIASDLTQADAPEEELYYVMLDTALGPMTYYHQGDLRWADYLYGGHDPMRGYGCGPTAAAMLISSFSTEGGGCTPVDIADWAAENGCYALHSGSYHKIIPEALRAYGFTVESVTERSSERASALLNEGYVLAALMGKGTLTQNGHFILITKRLENGNVRIADPNSYENSRKEWELDLLMRELQTSYDSGGPLWAVR